MTTLEAVKGAKNKKEPIISTGGAEMAATMAAILKHGKIERHDVPDYQNPLKWGEQNDRANCITTLPNNE